MCFSKLGVKYLARFSELTLRLLDRFEGHVRIGGDHLFLYEPVSKDGSRSIFLYILLLSIEVIFFIFLYINSLSPREIVQRARVCCLLFSGLFARVMLPESMFFQRTISMPD